MPTATGLRTLVERTRLRRGIAGRVASPLEARLVRLEERESAGLMLAFDDGAELSSRAMSMSMSSWNGQVVGHQHA
jgi:hypothetical protein